MRGQLPKMRRPPEKIWQTEVDKFNVIFKYLQDGCGDDSEYALPIRRIHSINDVGDNQSLQEGQANFISIVLLQAMNNDIAIFKAFCLLQDSPYLVFWYCR